MNWFRYARGLFRIDRGYCPECYSSPPRQNCRVCAGTYDYGYDITEARRAQWRRTWEAMRRGQ